ncbi:PBS lyase HEAT-like repeat protein [Rivularia sp. PCC 7116]|uniref:HEAT repeat domain-containing protein n=1 Tax=Rivularia sp. PCC 7116 TaxID=373994 RepID=UPI00029F3234|nr:HEAT repeat domain-containing protein [Rivularia sp. PCC 7116]AFY52915.1 PBS lyase HEAT-like repeat protein [Rivularia sp. PCC 7116]
MSLPLLSLTTSCTLMSQSNGVEVNTYAQQRKQQQKQPEDSKVSQLIEIIEQKYRLYKLEYSPEAKAASQELVEIGKPAVPKLINALRKNRILLTFGVAETLLKIAQKDSSVVPILINRLGDKDLQVRFGAMKALENDLFAPKLKKAAQNKNPRIAAGAIYVLGKIAADSSILPNLNNKNSLIHISTILALRDKTPEMFTTIKNALEHEDVFIRVNSALTLTFAIGYIDEISGVIDFDDVNKIAQVMVEGAGNEDSSIRFRAVQAFAQIYRIRYLYEIKPNPPLVPSLIKAIKDEDPGVRYKAMLIIAMMRNATKAAIPLLMEALNEKDERVRGAAALAFQYMGSDAKPAIPKIIAILQNKQENEQNRDYALRTLGNLKKNAVSAIPTLINTIEDKQNSRAIIIGAAQALEKIAPQVLILYIVKNISDKDKNFRASWLRLLQDATYQVKAKKNDLSTTELEKVISELETALKIIENSEYDFPLHIAPSLRNLITELKK